MASHTKIDAKQVAMVLTLSRVYNLLTYAPRRGNLLEGGAVVFSYLLSLLFTALAIWPIFRLLRRFEDRSFLDISKELWGRGSTLVAGLIWLVALLTAVGTTGGFEYLMTSGVYNTVPSAFLILTMLLVCLYAAYTGIEPLMRVGSFVFVAMLISFAFVGIALVPQYNWLYMRLPQSNQFAQIVGTAVTNTVGNLDLLVFLMVLPHMRGGKRGSFWGWMLATTVLYELLSVAATAAMGDYAKTQLFPFYSLTTIAEISIFQRLDVLHTALWVFLAFIKISLYLFVAAKCALFVLPRANKLLVHVVDVLVVGICAGAVSLHTDYLDGVYAAITTGGPMLLTVVAIPLVLLWTALWKRRRTHR